MSTGPRLRPPILEVPDAWLMRRAEAQALASVFPCKFDTGAAERTYLRVLQFRLPDGAWSLSGVACEAGVPTKQDEASKECQGLLWALAPLLTGSQPPGLAGAPTLMLPGQSWQSRDGCCSSCFTVALGWAKSTQDSVNEQNEHLKVSATQLPPSLSPGLSHVRLWAFSISRTPGPQHLLLCLGVFTCLH